jgi:hypothetical protein
VTGGGGVEGVQQGDVSFGNDVLGCAESVLRLG